jgi:hypothetical protein
MLFLEACYRADDKELATKVLKSVKTDLQQQVKFYNALTGIKADNMQYEKSNAQNMLGDLDKLQQAFTGNQPVVPENGNMMINDSVSPPKKDATKPKKK